MIKTFRTLLIILSFLSIFSCKQEKVKTISSFDIYQSYNTNQKAVFFNVPPGLVTIFLDESQVGNTELKDLLLDTKQLSFLIFSRSNSYAKECKYYLELNNRLDSINFYDLAQINNGKEIVRVKVEKNDTDYKELVVLVSNYDALYCISFKGKITPQKVVNLVKPENLGAVTNLDRFKR